MYQCEDIGVLSTGNRAWSDNDIAVAVGGDISENLLCLHELIEKGVASRNTSGAVYSRRIVRDEIKRKNNTERQRRYYDKRPNAQPNANLTRLLREPNADLTQTSQNGVGKETSPDVSLSMPLPSLPLKKPPEVTKDVTSAPKGALFVRKPRFKPPSLEELQAFLREKNSPVDAKAFHAFYESNGWMVGRNRMKSWKAAVVTWERNSPHKVAPPPRMELVG